MKQGAIVVVALWFVSAFAYAASVGTIVFASQAKNFGVIAVALLFIAALITRSKVYLNLYDRQILRTANTPVFFLKALTWALFFFTFIVLILHFSASDNSFAKSNNAFLSIFAFLTFFAGRSLLLRPFSR